MGGRGGSSHRSTATAALRIGRGQLAPYTNHQRALMQIIADTGMSMADAQIAHSAQISYYGSNYDAFTEGRLPDETEIISQALMKMPYYNGGLIYRGARFPNDVADKVFLDTWKAGTTQHFTDKLGNGNAVVQSFSSSEDVAENFGSWDYVGSGYTSIKFIMQGNKTAPGVQHISTFGETEAEVLLPSWQNVHVDRVVQVADGDFGGRRFEIYLTDKGRKVGRR